MNWNTANVQTGTYTFTVSAVDSNGKSSDCKYNDHGLVTGVTYQNGVPYLSVNGQNVAFGDILYITKSGWELKSQDGRFRR